MLRIDLTDKSIKTEAIEEEILRKYLGGSGLGTKILYDETDKDTDPLGPDNLLIFMTGPLVGTNIPNFGRHQAITRSPLTGSFGEGNTGGSWGSKL
jgi:aldehyde:ferredoxin oxidoreductase